MTTRWVMIVGIDKPLHPELGSQAYAEADANAWSAALESAGVRKANQIVLCGAFATKTAVESRLRWLKKQLKKDDDLLNFWAGCGHDRYLHCWDTLPSDADETAMDARELLKELTAMKASQVTGFFAVTGLDVAQLAKPFHDSSKAVGLFACSQDEGPLSTPAIKHGVWSQLVADALSGKARVASKQQQLTALNLQRYIDAELPRRLRKHFDSGVRQTPQLLGEQNSGNVILELSIVDDAAESVLDPARLRRIVFRSETTSRVRDLIGFRKSYTVPDNAGPANRKFVQRIAVEDLQNELDRVVKLSRETFDYKRKDLVSTVGQDGTASLRTPDFEFTLYLDLDVDDPSQVVLRREIGQFADAAFIRQPEFQSGLGAMFDQLVFEFAKPLDVAEFIDRIEDAPPDGVKLTIGSDDKSCDITLNGFAGTVSVKRHAIVVRGRSSHTAGLLDLFLQFLAKVGPLGEPLLLPAARRS